MINKFFLFILIITFCSCGKVPTPEPNEPFEHVVGDFETGNLYGFGFLAVDTAVNTKIVTSPVRKGSYALMNTLRPDDYIYNGYRTELAIYNCAKYKSEVYYGFSIMIDTNYLDQEYNLICQWQDLPYYEQGEDWKHYPYIRVSPPPVALIYVNGTLELKMNESPMSNNKTFTVGDAKPIAKGQWQDIVAHIYWDEKDDAFIELWLNGNFMTPFNGTNNKFYKRNLFNRAGNYFKFGQYRGKEKTAHTNIIYFDEVKIGSSYEEVAP